MRKRLAAVALLALLVCMTMGGYALSLIHI